MRDLKVREFFTTLTKKDRLKSFIIIFILSAVYIFIFSESGLLERLKLERNKQDVVNRINSQEDDKKELIGIYKDYQDGKQKKSDIQQSGYIKRDGRLVFIKGISEKKLDERPVESEKSDFIEVSHLRIIWIIVSILIFLLYSSRKVKSNGP